MKQCTKCKTNKSLSDFHSDPSKPHGKTNVCKPCRNARELAYYYKNKERILIKAKQTRKDNPNKERGYRLKYRYNLNLEDYNKMLLNQNNACYICKSSNPGGKGNFLVDHNHSNNSIRGLLCLMCNFIIGYIETKQSNGESINITIEQYVSYLKSFNQHVS